MTACPHCGYDPDGPAESVLIVDMGLKTRVVNALHAEDCSPSATSCAGRPPTNSTG